MHFKNIPVRVACRLVPEFFAVNNFLYILKADCCFLPTAMTTNIVILIKMFNFIVFLLSNFKYFKLES